MPIKKVLPYTFTGRTAQTTNTNTTKQSFPLNNSLTPDKLEEIMSAQKPSVAPREPVVNINVSKVAQYFPTGCTKQQMENRILKILESYFRQMAHEQAHEEER